MSKETLKLILTYFCIMFVTFFFVYKFAGTLGRYYLGPVSFKETLEKIPEITLIALSASLILTYMDPRRKK